MKAENIFIIENECQIIKPKIIKRKNSSIDFSNILKKFDKSFLKNKKDYSTLEILSILSEPIEPIYKKRKFPNNKNNLNNERENFLNNSNNMNIYINKNELNGKDNSTFLNISNLLEINNNISLKEKF